MVTVTADGRGKLSVIVTGACVINVANGDVPWLSGAFLANVEQTELYIMRRNELSRTCWPGIVGGTAFPSHVDYSISVTACRLQYMCPIGRLIRPIRAVR